MAPQTALAVQEVLGALDSLGDALAVDETRSEIERREALRRVADFEADICESFRPRQRIAV